MLSTFSVLVLGTAFLAHAAETPYEEKVKVPDGFQTMDFEAANDSVKTKESIVTIGDSKYRRIEYQKKNFYLKLLVDPDASVSEMICDDETRKNDPRPLVEGRVELTQRTSFFIDGLERSCVEYKGTTVVRLTPTIRIGFLWKGSPKDLIQNKRVFITPGGLGAMGDF